MALYLTEIKTLLKEFFLNDALILLQGGRIFRREEHRSDAARQAGLRPLQGEGGKEALLQMHQRVVLRKVS